MPIYRLMTTEKDGERCRLSVAVLSITRSAEADGLGWQPNSMVTAKGFRRGKFESPAALAVNRRPEGNVRSFLGR